MCKYSFGTKCFLVVSISNISLAQDCDQWAVPIYLNENQLTGQSRDGGLAEGPSSCDPASEFSNPHGDCRR